MPSAESERAILSLLEQLIDEMMKMNITLERLINNQHIFLAILKPDVLGLVKKIAGEKTNGS